MWPGRWWFGGRQGQVSRSGVGFFVFVGVVMLIASFGALLDIHGLKTGALTRGVVTRYDASGRFPIVTLRFTTDDGSKFDCDTENFDGHPRPGQPVEVRYDQEDPAENCAIKGSEAGYGDFVATLVIAAASLAYAGRLIHRRRDQNRVAPGIVVIR